MKKGKLFAKILYFVFTFIIGILLALFLPYIFMYYGESVNVIQDALNEGRYSDAMALVGGYYDSVPVYQADFERGGGIVIFAAASLIPSEQDEEGNVVEDAKLHKAYSGFLYGTKSYYVTEELGENETKLFVTDSEGKEQTVELLDSDLNEDGVKDCVATYSKLNFLYFDFGQETYGGLKKLSFADKNGDVIIEVDLNLDFGETFFADVSAFVEEYNRDYKSEALPALDEEFRGKNENYAISSAGVAKSGADKKAAAIVVAYFVFIYLVYDFILGSHIIIKFFKWLLVKVFKVKFKTKETPKEAFGNDYYCKFTLIADVSELEGFDESVQVRYSDEKEDVTFILLKQDNYTATVSVKAGSYGNLWVDMNEKYLTQNLPDILEVEGYHKQLTFKIIKRED